MKRCLSWVTGLMLLAAAPAAAVVGQSNANAPAKAKPQVEELADEPDNAPAREASAKGATPATAATAVGSPAGTTTGGDAPETGIGNFSDGDGTPAPEDEGIEAGEAGNALAPPQPVAATGIAAPTPLWLTALSIVALLLVIGGFLWMRLSDASARITRLENKVTALDAVLRRIDQASSVADTDAFANIAPEPAARIGGYEAGWATPEPPTAPLAPNEPKPAAQSFDQAAAPSARAATSSVSLVPLQEELARLIANPAMRTADYDDLLRRYGEARGYEVRGDDGSGRLTPNDSDPNRRLTALILTDSDMVALLPSARFIRDFMLYKERLEAGGDVKTLFHLEADGSAHLRIVQLAHGRSGSDGTVHSVQRGRLDGFLR